MKTVQKIYEQYRIMPGLQLHQLRVAGVAKMMCDHFNEPIRADDVVLACLFHDMGNIVKSDLSLFPEFLKPEGRAHWEFVKAEYIRAYGGEQHSVNAAIAHEIGLPERIVKWYDVSGFSKLAGIVKSDSLELKVYQYADLRVGPHGVLSLESRLAEGRARYAARRRPHYANDEAFAHLSAQARTLEKQLFAKINIAPEDITEEAVAPLIEELRKYEVA